MKVINHTKGNYKGIGTDSAVYYGTIEMNIQEFIEARDKLLEYIEQHKGEYEIQNTKWIIRDAIPKKTIHDKYYCTSFRVTYTRILFDLYNLPNYKHQNYRIIIK